MSLAVTNGQHNTPVSVIHALASGQMPAPASDIVLETHNLTREFSGFKAVQDVNLRVRRGSIHALIGPNGAGKTTCFNLLTRFLSASSGKIVFNGEDITRTPPAKLARMGLVRSFQISSVFSNLTALENVRVALQRLRGASFDFWQSTACLRRYEAKALALLEDVGLADYANTKAALMPYGRKRALEFATTLALEPELMLLDEPLAGLGQEDIARITALIEHSAKGRTILMVEHNLKVVAHLSHTITVLTRGQVLMEGDYATVSSSPAVQQAYLGQTNTAAAADASVETEHM